MKRPLVVLLGSLPVLAVAIVAAVLETPESPAALQGACVEESDRIPAFPGGLATGPDGKLWYSDPLDEQVGSYDAQTGRVTELDVPEGTAPHFVAAGRDDVVWFSGLGDTLGRIDLESLEIELFTEGITPGSVPHAVAPMPDGESVYFTEQEGGRLARFDVATGEIEEFDEGLPPRSRPHGLALDPGGDHLWVALQGADRIARFDLEARVFDRFVEFSAGSGPHDIRVGPDGRTLYVTLQGGSRLGEYEPASGSKREYETAIPIPAVPDLEPAPKLVDVIASTTSDAVWITTFMADRLLRFDTAEKRFKELTCGITPGGGTLEVAIGPDGAIWFTEPLGSRIARLDE